MSFGFSIGDFITVGRLCYNVWDRCKSAAEEFRDLSREVISMHIVLKAIETYWKAETDRENDLSADQKDDLKRLAAGCEEVLGELEKLMDTHKNLARGASFISRMRWVPKDINKIRNTLMLRTTLLSTFNSTITATSNAHSHALLLEALNVIHSDYEMGRRAVAAFSSVTMEELNDPANNAWEEIEADIQSEGIPVMLVRENQAFVRDWIDKVILEEPGEDDRDGADIESPPWPPSATPPLTGMTNLTLGSPLQSPSPGQLKRTSFNSSHSSKDSTWRPVDGPNPEYVQGLLNKLMQLEDPIDGNLDKMKLIAKRMYHQLDWAGRRFLHRFTVEDELRKCIVDIGIPETDLARLVIVADKNKDGKIDLEELEDLLLYLVRLVGDLTEQAFCSKIATCVEQGYAMANMLVQLKTQHSIAPLLWGWEKEISPNGLWVFSHDLDKSIMSNQIPLADRSAFCVQYHIATKICIPMLSRALDGWTTSIVTLPRAEYEEYWKAIDAVLNSASAFFVYETDRQSRPRNDHELDEFIAVAELVPVNGDEFPNSPLQDAKALRDKSNSLLGAILGFMVAMGLERAGYGVIKSKPPSLRKWRKLRMQERARRITESTAQLLEVDDVVDRCRSWATNYSVLRSDPVNGITLASDTVERVKQTLALRDAQLAVRDDAAWKLARDQGRRQGMVTVTIVGATNLATPRPNNLPNPTAYLQYGGSMRYISEAKNTCDPKWNASVRLLAATGSYTVEIYSGKRNQHFLRPNAKLMGKCVFTVNDLNFYNNYLEIVPTKPRKARIKGYGSYLEVRIEPDKVPKPATPRTVSSIQHLMDCVLADPLPEGWRKEETPDGGVCFMPDAGTGTIVCTSSPAGGGTQQYPAAISGANSDFDEDHVLPEGWEMKMNNFGKAYYVNSTTKKSQWKKPGREPSP